MVHTYKVFCAKQFKSKSDWAYVHNHPLTGNSGVKECVTWHHENLTSNIQTVDYSTRQRTKFLPQINGKKKMRRKSRD